jgi:uncharacterized metal-binding protein YceD (DUF177 family)
LKLDLQILGESSCHLSGENLDFSSLHKLEEVRIVGVPVVDMQYIPDSDDSFILQGRVQGVQILNCVRTLEDFECPFDVLLTVLVSKDNAVAEQQLDDSDEDRFLVRMNAAETVLDLTECLRQMVLLEQPMSPRKNPEGRLDWVDTEHENRPENEKIDPRWAKLKELQDRMGKE